MSERQWSQHTQAILKVVEIMLDEELYDAVFLVQKILRGMRDIKHCFDDLRETLWTLVPLLMLRGTVVGGQHTAALWLQSQSNRVKLWTFFIEVVHETSAQKWEKKGNIGKFQGASSWNDI